MRAAGMVHSLRSRSISRQVARIAQLGVEVAMVCGGGNLLRGAEFAAGGARRASSDCMPM